LNWENVDVMYDELPILCLSLQNVFICFL